MQKFKKMVEAYISGNGEHAEKCSDFGNILKVEPVNVSGASSSPRFLASATRSMEFPFVEMGKERGGMAF